MCSLPAFNSTTDVFCVYQKSCPPQVKMSCQPYVYYICKQYAVARVCAVHEIIQRCKRKIISSEMRITIKQMAKPNKKQPFALRTSLFNLNG